ncbi:MAG: Ig-like domain-containing protein, partial [Ignavibacteria bacterium]
MLKYLICTAILIMMFFYSCANQLPPSGGEDDKIAPKVVSISPKPDMKNYKGNKLVFRFDEYVDRRSFEESFYIFPKPAGVPSFDWSGKEVEVQLPVSLKKDQTYVVTIGNELKDVRGSNRLE